MKEWYLFTEVFYLLITQDTILLCFLSGNCDDIVKLISNQLNKEICHGPQLYFIGNMFPKRNNQ